MRPEIYKQVDTIGNTIDLVVNWELSECFVAIRYYDADPTAGAANEVTPGAGTVTVTAKLATHERFVSIVDGVIDATVVNTFVSFKGNATIVRAIPAGLTVATHYQIVVSQNAPSGFNILDPLGSGANIPAVSGIMSTSTLIGTDGEKQTWTLAANSTIAFDLVDGQGTLLRIISGGFTVNFDAVDLWVGQIATTVIDPDHLFIFWNDGGDIIGQEIGVL